MGDHSQFFWLYLMKHKNEVTKILKNSVNLLKDNLRLMYKGSRLIIPKTSVPMSYRNSLNTREFDMKPLVPILNRMGWLKGK